MIPNPQNYIAQDNSKLRNEVHNLFERGDFKFNKGNSLDEKEEGITLQIQGLKKLQLWIDREGEPVKKQKLQEIYQQKYQKVSERMTTLEAQKKKIEEPQPMAMGGSKQQGGGGDGKDNEKDKFKDMISEAIVREKPNVSWDDIAGLHNAKAALKEAVIMPIKFPQIFEGVRKPWKGILLYGPPGTGKSYLAKACATEADACFFSISAADLVSKFVGETEKMIRALFNLARENKPSIIFIDECDSMFGARGDGQQEASRRAITEFLTQMQGVGRDDTGVLVLGATNLPWALDAAVRRRFEKRIYIPLPDEAARTYMMSLSLQKVQHTITEQEINEFGKITDGYSGSDISVVVKDAVMQPVRLLQTTNRFKKIVNNGKVQFMPINANTPLGGDVCQMNFMELQTDQLLVPQVTEAEFRESIAKCKPSVSHDQLKEYENFTKTFGQDG